MATRSRRNQHQPEEKEEDDQSQEELASLEFNEPLTWRPGKAIGVHVLIPRLERLSKELMDLEQETTEKESLNKVAKDLASSNLLHHKDKGVKALTAACLVDILRICAPDAPFTPQQLKDIFTFYIRHILPGLKDPTASYYTQYKHVLSSLAEVQSILLLNEVDQPDDLMVQLFSVLFDTVSSTSKTSADGISSGDIEYQATEMLSCVVDEGQGLPTKLVDVIMAQFLRAAQLKRERVDGDSGQSTLELKEVPAAYSMAAAICTRCVDKMSRYVGQYFSDVIFEASGGLRSNGHRGHDDDENEPSGPSEDDLKELRKAHQLVRELWRAAPSVMSNVIPQLEQELNADNVEVRQIATETLGDMIAGVGAAGPPAPPSLDPLTYPPLKMSDEAASPNGNVMTRPMVLQSFPQAHSHVFRNFMNRRNDKSASIRASWTTAIGYILSTKAGGTGLTTHDQADMVKFLSEKLSDSDERVRLAGIKAIESFCFQDIVTVLGPSGGVDKKDSVLCNLADRCRDKRAPVRTDSTVLLAKLWAVAAGEIAAGDEAVSAALSGIPSRLFNAYYANDKELNALLDWVIFEHLMPLGFPPAPPKSKSKQTNGNSQSHASLDQDKVRAERVLLLVRSLDPTAKKALWAMHSRQPQFARVVSTYIGHCERFNAGVVDGDATAVKGHLNSTAAYIAQFFPDPEKVKSDLGQFAKLHDRRSYQLIKFSVSNESDFKTVYRAIKELNKRFHDETHKRHTQLLDTLIPLLYRSSCLLFNRSYLATFMDHSRHDEDGYGSAAHEILNEISSRNPDLFKTHADTLRKDLETHAPNNDGEQHPGVVESLKAYSSYSQKYPGEVPQDRKFVQALMKHALYGPAKGSKLAVNIILARGNQESSTNATTLLQKVMEDWKYGSPFFLNRLATVAQLEVLAPAVALDAEDEILDMTLKQILFKVRTPAKDDDPTFVDDISQSDEELQAKVLALKINVNRVLGITNADEAKEKGAPVFKLLRNILNKSGEMSKDPEKPTPQHHQARLRLTAAKLFLKLCVNHTFDDLLTPTEFDLLSYTVQDPQPMVRRGFIERLQKYLSLSKLRHRFYTAIFLTAYEPSKELKAGVETWIRSRVRLFEQRGSQLGLESIMGRLISLLAHHPDFGTEPRELLDHALYLIYYVSLVATEENIGMIFKYAERVKQTRDAVYPDQSERVYMVCDLAMAVVRRWQERKNWVFQAYGGKIGLPKGLYVGLPSHKAAQEISEKQYIPEGVEERLDDKINEVNKKGKKQKRRPQDDGGSRPSKRAKTSGDGSKEKKHKSSKKRKAGKPKVSKKAASTSAAIPESERRRSGRSRPSNKSYIERDSSEDEKEMLEGVAQWTYEDSDTDESGSEVESGEGSEEGEEGAGSDDEAMDEGKDDKGGEDEEMKDAGAAVSVDVPVRTRGGRGKPGAKARKAEEDEEELSDAPDEAEEEEEPAASRQRGRRGVAAAAAKTNRTGPGRKGRGAAAAMASESELSSAPEGEGDEADIEAEAEAKRPKVSSLPSASRRGKRDRRASSSAAKEKEEVAPAAGVRSSGRATRSSRR